MAIIDNDKEPLEIKANRLDMELLHLLECKYNVVVWQESGNVNFRLYDKNV